jgi:hypothetical protein
MGRTPLVFFPMKIVTKILGWHMLIAFITVFVSTILTFLQTQIIRQNLDMPITARSWNFAIASVVGLQFVIMRCLLDLGLDVIISRIEAGAVGLVLF